jgi:protein arginine N-methyltransferase 1
MDRRKGSGSRDANGGGLAEATASRLRFEDADEVGMEVEVEDCPAAAAAEEVIGNEKTSADYYFDSYSHFGTPPLHPIRETPRFPVDFC